jgi:hypothetical protein
MTGRTYSLKSKLLMTLCMQGVVFTHAASRIALAGHTLSSKHCMHVFIFHLLPLLDDEKIHRH